MLCALTPLDAVAVTHEYSVRLETEPRQVVVRAELASPERLTARDGSTWRLRNLRGCDGQTVSKRRGGIEPGNVRCVEYTYPVRAVSERIPLPGVLATRPSEWLWIPRLGAEDEVRIQWQGITGVQYFPPWSPHPRGGYRLKNSPNSDDGLMLIGNLAVTEVTVGDTTLPVALVGTSLDPEKMRQWLRPSLRAVYDVGQRFPNPLAHIVLVDVPAGGGSAVPFGHVIRDGAETVRFFVQGARSLDDLHGDWTASHEFAHLLIPYVRNKWVSEGIASYYQNVLMGRTGAYSEREAWQRLTNSFAQTRALRNPPSLMDTPRRSFWDVRMLIYWGGAALALMADVELRRTGAGSLDETLGRLSACCLPSADVWSARRLYAELDRLSETTVFTDLYRRYAEDEGLPPVERLYEDLGIERVDGVVTLRDDAPLAEVRRAIMRRPPLSASL